MKVWKSFYFEASHTLPDNPQIHGHSYLVRLWFESSPETPVELNQIEKLEWQLHRCVDHKHLNDMMKSPTMEQISAYLLKQGHTLIQMQNIRVNLLSVDVERPSLNFGVQA
jgi:6-pyruvoyl-tetrahydropterin synthase